MASMASPPRAGDATAVSTFLGYLWNGLATLPRTLQLEWRFVAVRWLGIVTIAPGLAFFRLEPTRLLAAYALIAVAVVYNLGVQTLLTRRPGLIRSGYATAIGDGALNIAMVTVGTGFNSPFYYLLFTVTIAAAMRFGYGPALSMVIMFVSLDAVESRLLLHSDVVSPFLFRSGFLLITAVLAGYLREQTRRAEAALHERLRQAHLLDTATARLGASLEPEQALHAVAAAACDLFGGAWSVLRPTVGLAGVGPQQVIYPAALDSPARAECDALCGHILDAAGEREESAESAAVPAWETLPSGHRVVALHLATRARQTALATLVIAAPDNGTLSDLAPDIQDSFVERITLAIENASLYRAVADRTTDLQRAYADLATAHQDLLGVDEMKTNFLANVSHELRTPLSSIRSFSELLLSYEDDRSVQQEFLGIINTESERLTRLVNDVLDITKIEAGQMDWSLTRVDLSALLQDTARAHGGLIAAQRLSFHQDIAADLPSIQADRDRLQQVIGNLLGNAVKFTPAGAVTLSARLHHDEIWIAVEDTGIGIAPEDQGRIFEKFQQVGDTLTEKPHGTGLGLCICRDIVAYHGGRLWVESRPGVGSTFTFTMPVRDALDASTTTSGEDALDAPTTPSLSAA